MSDNPPAVPLRSTSMKKWAPTNLALNSQGQVSLPQGSQISQVVTPMTRSGSEYPPLPPETRPHRPPRQRAIVTALDAQLVTSPGDGAKVDDGQFSIRQLGDTDPSRFEQTTTDADKVGIPPQQTPVQSTGVGLQSQKNPYENTGADDQDVQTKMQTCCAEVQTDDELQSQWNANKVLSFGQGVQTDVQTCCAEVQTDGELQSQRDSSDTAGIGQAVQTRVQTCCVEVQTDFAMQPLRSDAMTVAAEIQTAEHTQHARVTQLTLPSVPSVPSVLSDDDSSIASSVGGGQAASRIPLRFQASQSIGSAVSPRSTESPTTGDGSSEFSVDSPGDNVQPGRHEIHHHHHHHHHHHTHNYSHCTVTQHNTNLSGGQIDELDEQHQDD